MKRSDNLANMMVSEVLRLWPATALVFNEYRTACVGCAMASFDSLADVAKIYGFELDGLLVAINRAIDGDQHQED